MAGKRKYGLRHILDAIDGSWGIKSNVVKRLGCDWRTFQRWLDGKVCTKAEHRAVLKAWENERTKVLDKAESNLINGICEGDSGDSKWVLSRLGRDRGYGDKQEVEHTGEVTANVVFYVPDNGRMAKGEDSE